MENWIERRDNTVEIPFSKLIVSDGVNMFFGRLLKKVINQSGKILFFEVYDLPINYGEFEVSHWRKLELPKK